MQLPYVYQFLFSLYKKMYSQNVLYKKCIAYKMYERLSIYIVICSKTVSLNHNSSVWHARKTLEDWDRNPPNFTLDLVSYRSANK